MILHETHDIGESLQIFHVVGRDRTPLRKQYIEAILPPFIVVLRMWRPLLAGTFTPDVGCSNASSSAPTTLGLKLKCASKFAVVKGTDGQGYATVERLGNRSVVGPIGDSLGQPHVRVSVTEAAGIKVVSATDVGTDVVKEPNAGGLGLLIGVDKVIEDKQVGDLASNAPVLNINNRKNNEDMVPKVIHSKTEVTLISDFNVQRTEVTLISDFKVIHSKTEVTLISDFNVQRTEVKLT